MTDGFGIAVRHKCVRCAPLRALYKSCRIAVHTFRLRSGHFLARVSLVTCTEMQLVAADVKVDALR